MSEWKKICLVDDIPVLGSRRVARQNGIDVAVFRNGTDEVFALLDRCPHKGGPLSQGIVFGTTVACPLHNWTIGLADGCANAPDEGCTPRFSVQVSDGCVHLDALELATHALDLPRPVAGPKRADPGGANDAGRSDSIAPVHSPEMHPVQGNIPASVDTGRVMPAAA